MLSPEEISRRTEELAQRRALKRRKRRRNILVMIFMFLFGTVLMVLTAYYSYHQGFNPVESAAPSEQRIHILFLGIDEKSVSGSRADTIMLVSLDMATGEAGVLSIPRDTRVFISDRNRWDRVNAAHAYGGPALVMKTVAELLDIQIDYYIQTDFVGFSKIVDILGGVEIDVERNMQYDDHAQNLHINLSKGRQVLDGDKALQYVRFRDGLGDVSLVDPLYQSYGGRIERQRKFVQALVKKVLRPATIPKLPKLIGQLWEAVDTNLPWGLALKLTFAADQFNPDKIITAVVPGVADKINGASYWVPDQARLQRLVGSVVHGEPLPLTVEVLNGSGITGIASIVGESLVNAGFDLVRLGNADHFNYLETQVIVGSNTGVSDMNKLVELLGQAIIIEPERSDKPDVTVIIGKDYQP